MKILRFIAVLLTVLIGSLVLLAYFVRPGLSSYRAHRYAGAPAAPDALTVTWFGVTALLVSDGEHALMIDPFFTRPGGWLRFLSNGEIAPDENLIAQSLKRAGVQHLDAVLVSHSHFDHAMDAGVVARLTGATLVGSASTLNIGRGASLPENLLHLVNPEQPLHFGKFTVTFFQSRHAGATGGRPTGDILAPLVPPAHYLDYKQGGTYSILVQHPQGSLLHHGSAGFVPGALAGHRADVVFLGIALRERLDTYLAEVVDAVGAKRVIPMHWDDFTRGLDRPLIPLPLGARLENFFDEMEKRPDLSVETLEPFQPVVLFRKEAPAK